MIIKAIQSAQQTNTVSPASKAFTSNVMAGSLIVVAATAFSGTAVPSCTDSVGNVYRTLTPFINNSAFEFVFFTVNSKTGALTVTVTETGATFDWAIHEFNGILSSNPFIGCSFQNLASGAAIIKDTPLMVSDSPDAVVFGFNLDGSSNGTVGQNFTELQAFGFNRNGETEYKIVNTPGMYNAIWGNNVAGETYGYVFRGGDSQFNWRKIFSRMNLISSGVTNPMNRMPMMGIT